MGVNKWLYIGYGEHASYLEAYMQSWLLLASLQIYECPFSVLS